MDLIVSGRNVAVTDAMRENARQRAEKLQRFSPHLTRVTITLAIEGDRHMAEAVGVVRTKGEAVAKADSADMYASIDQAVTRLERQLQKMEARFRDHRDATRQKGAAGGIPSAEEASGTDDSSEDDNE